MQSQLVIIIHTRMIIHIHVYSKMLFMDCLMHIYILLISFSHACEYVGLLRVVCKSILAEQMCLSASFMSIKSQLLIDVSMVSRPCHQYCGHVDPRLSRKSQTIGKERKYENEKRITTNQPRTCCNNIRPLPYRQKKVSFFV